LGPNNNQGIYSFSVSHIPWDSILIPNLFQQGYWVCQWVLDENSSFSWIYIIFEMFPSLIYLIKFQKYVSWRFIWVSPHVIQLTSISFMCFCVLIQKKHHYYNSFFFSYKFWSKRPILDRRKKNLPIILDKLF